MAKDPAFLFYPNDWIGGTMGMTFEEKGAYMELLMLQFNRGHMTYDMMAQTVGRILDKVLDKFKKDDNGLYFNERLEHEQNKRKSFVASRLNNKSGKNQHGHKNGHMTTHMSSHMENENVNSIEIEYLLSKLREIESVEIGESQENLYTMIVLKMVETFRKHNPDYFFDKETDYKAALQIAYNIAQMKKWKRDSVLNGHMDECVASWEKIVDFVKTDKWFSSRSLSDLSTIKEWQRLVQSMKNATPAPAQTVKKMVD